MLRVERLQLCIVVFLELLVLLFEFVLFLCAHGLPLHACEVIKNKKRKSTMNMELTTKLDKPAYLVSLRYQFELGQGTWPLWLLLWRGQTTYTEWAGLWESHP